MKPLPANQRLTKVAIRARAISRVRRWPNRPTFQKGRVASWVKDAAAAVKQDRGQSRLAFGAKTGMVPVIATNQRVNNTPCLEGETTPSILRTRRESYR